MVQGNMCLNVMERGAPKSIPIKQGELFLLPARIPHSPQRLADTIGLVIERERQKGEWDGLRWYVSGNPAQVSNLFCGQRDEEKQELVERKVEGEEEG